MDHLRAWTYIYRRPRLVCALRAVSILGEGISALALLACALQLLWLGDVWAVLALLTPLGVGLVAVSWWRARRNAPRPYELYTIEGMPPRHRVGCSFPSRHAFCAFAIAVAGMGCCVPVGALVLLFALLQCAARYLLGVHFPRDLLAGALLGILCGGAAGVCLILI